MNQTLPQFVAHPSKTSGQPHSARGTSRATTWLELSRMTGIPTLLFVALATPLHGIDCELRKETVHWGTATFLITMSLVTALTLFLAYRMVYRALLMLSALIAILLMASLFVSEFCTTHQSLLTILVIVNSSCAVASWCSRPLGDLGAGLHSTTSASTVEGTTLGIREASGDAASGPTGAGERAADLLSTADDCTAVSSDLRTSRRPRWQRYGVFVLLTAAALVYMVVIPAVNALIDALSTKPTVIVQELTDMSLSEKLRLHSVSGVVMLIFLATGASVGSFLNVVIYRLPRRLALLWPPSACPKCASRIQSRDNIPILGWINLGGRCRHCTTNISSRYPAIEALVAVVFVLFFYRELLSGGENLAVRRPNTFAGIVWVLLYTKWDLVSIYTLHMIVLAVVLAWGMINYDRFRVPRIVGIGTAFVAATLVSLYPFLNPTLTAGNVGGASASSAWLSTFASGILGAGIGYVLQLLFRMEAVELETPVLPSSDEPSATSAEVATGPVVDDPYRVIENDESPGQTTNYASNAVSQPLVATSDCVASLALVGVVFGGTAVVVIALFSVLARLALVKKPIPMTLLIFWSSLLHLAFWGSIHQMVQVTVQQATQWLQL